MKCKRQIIPTLCPPIEHAIIFRRNKTEEVIAMTKEELRKTWEERVAAFKASGQSASAWCAAHDLKTHQLFYWLQKYKNNTSAPATAPFPWLTMEINKQNPDSTQGDYLLIRLGQATIEVKAGFNPTLLTDVVRILAGIC